MVHALKEIHRLLKTGGTLIDLRPHYKNRDVLLELPSATLSVGEIDSTATVSDQLAANDAIQQAVDLGFYTLEHQTDFTIYIDLDTADDLRNYGDSLRRSILPDEVLQRVIDLTADESNDYSIRIRRALTIARYRKCP